MYILCLDEFIADVLLGKDAIDHVAHQMEAVEIVQHGHVERRRGRAFFLIAAHMEVVVVGAAVRQAVNQPRIAVEGEDDRFVLGEERIEVLVAESPCGCSLAAAASSDRRR